MFDFKALLQFIPQMIIATVVAVYFIYEMDRKNLSPPEFILQNRVKPTIEDKERDMISQQKNYYGAQKTPFDPKYLEKEQNTIFMGIQTASISLWTAIFLAFTPLTLVKIFIPVKSNFIDSIILIVVAALFAITFVALYSIFKSRGLKGLAIGEAAALIVFFVVTYFPSFSWFSTLSLLVKIVVIYFYAIAMLFLIYAMLNMKSREKKLAIFLYGSICTYGIFAVLLFSELLIKFKI